MKTIFLFLFLLMLANQSFSQTAITPSGSGTSGDPYLIESLDNLYWVTQNPGSWSSYFKQVTDINASSTSGWDSEKGFLPIGSLNNNFKGSYDGDGHTIDSLYISRSIYGVGFFGYAAGLATIKNIGLTNVNITGYNSVGGLVGTWEGSSISNSYTTGSVSGNTDYVGGLAGTSSNLTISNSYSNCSVKGSNYVGGLIGASYYSTINSCYSSGSVSGGASVGGLVGKNENGSKINNCYSADSVSGISSAGGLVGANVSGSTVSNSYSTGYVSGIDGVGGLAGVNNGGSIEKSFWDKETSGVSVSAGGTGKTTAEMKTQSTFTDSSWDFSTVWAIDNSINDGYPYFQWQIEEGGNQSPVIVKKIPDFTFQEDTGPKILSLDLYAYFNDPDGGKDLTFSTLFVNGDEKINLSVQQVNNTYVLSGNAIKNEFGVAPFYVTAKDTGDLSVTDTVNITVTPINDPPVVNLPDTIKATAGVTYSLQLSDISNIPDSLRPVYDIDTPDSLLAFQVSYTPVDGNFTITFNKDTYTISGKAEHSGKYKVYVSVTDDSSANTIDSTLIYVQNPTGLKDDSFNNSPKEYSLFQNYPNPFNPSTRIKFYIPNNSAVTIKIYDMLGKEVTTLVNNQREAGYHIVYWNGKDKYGRNAASGIYIYRLTAVNNSNSIFTETKKMTLLK